MKIFLPRLIRRVFAQDVVATPYSDPHPIFNTFQEALRFCTKDSYEDLELVEVISKKTQRFIEGLQSKPISIWETTAYSLIAMINPLIESGFKQINVLDFGGACGAHYFHLKSIFGDQIRLNWVVVETPTMVKAGKKYENDDLTFADNIEDAQRKLQTIDILHTSGTLQCVNNPLEYLEHFLAIDAKWILFSRLGLNKNDKSVITIHKSMLSWNGIGDLPEGHIDREITYPFTFLSEKSFLARVKKKYAPFARFTDTSGMFPLPSEEIIGYGLLCKRHDA